MEIEGALSYKGYFTKPEYSQEDGVYYGELLGIKDMVSFHSKSRDGFEDQFHNAVDDYLDFCKEIGKAPEV